jgi:hypothetical protein
MTHFPFGAAVCKAPSVRLSQVFGDRAQRVSKELCRREGQLVTLLRLAGLPRPASVKALTCAPRTGELSIDVRGGRRLECAGSEVVRRDETRDCGLDERAIIRVEERIRRAAPALLRSAFTSGGTTTAAVAPAPIRKERLEIPCIFFSLPEPRIAAISPQLGRPGCLPQSCSGI